MLSAIKYVLCRKLRNGLYKYWMSKFKTIKMPISFYGTVSDGKSCVTYFVKKI